MVLGKIAGFHHLPVNYPFIVGRLLPAGMHGRQGIYEADGIGH